MKPDIIDKMSEKRLKIGHILRVLSEYLEIILAVLILVGIIFRFVYLPEELSEITSGTKESYHAFIDFVVDSVIGVELVHLLCQPNLDSVVEILLVAITREIIMLEGNAVATLLYIISLGILFLLRRYMFIDKLDRHDSDFSLKTLKEHWARKQDINRNDPASAATEKAEEPSSAETSDQRKKTENAQYRH